MIILSFRQGLLTMIDFFHVIACFSCKHRKNLSPWIWWKASLRVGFNAAFGYKSIQQLELQTLVALKG